MVPDASDFVTFSVAEPAVLVSTGSDHCDHTRVTLPQRQMYMGKIRIAVKPAKGQQTLELTALGRACGCASIQVECPPESGA